MIEPTEPTEPTESPAPTEPRVDAPTALSYGWTKFWANTGPLLLAVAIPIVAEILVAVVARVLFDSAARRFLFQIVGLVIGAIAGLGLRRVALQITAGETPDLGAALRYDRWAPWIVFSVVFALVEGVGIVLCVIPGMLFLAYFGLAPYFFLERGMSTVGALRASREVIVRKGLAFPVLLSIVVGALGLLVFGVGIFVTEAVAAIALAFLYRHAVDEPVAE